MSQGFHQPVRVLGVGIVHGMTRLILQLLAGRDKGALTIPG